MLVDGIWPKNASLDWHEDRSASPLCSNEYSPRLEILVWDSSIPRIQPRAIGPLSWNANHCPHFEAMALTER
jgi:hypothetical protein